jgi:hypothetical protein
MFSRTAVPTAIPGMALAIAILAGGVLPAHAQTTTEPQTVDTKSTAPKSHRWDFDIPSGSLVPTGTQRGDVKRGLLNAAQLSYFVRPNVAVTATFGWATSRDLRTFGRPRVDVYTYDLGAEVRAPQWIAGHDLSFSPFAGAGAGGRSYNYRHLDVDATHNVAAYLSAGGELGFHWVRLRVEVRDYVTGFKPLAGGGAADVRNDMTVLVGLRFGRR